MPASAAIGFLSATLKNNLHLRLVRKNNGKQTRRQAARPLARMALNRCPGLLDATGQYTATTRQGFPWWALT